MRQFHELFVGRDDAYGRYKIGPSATPNERGKLEGQAYTKRDVVTEELYASHLAGEESLGIVPIRIDGTTMWFAIDVDTYDNDSLHRGLLQKIKDNSLPLVMTKSKSGGAHLWCFLTEPMLAKQAIEVASQYLKILGLPKDTEIFPKQTEVDKENVGNWINLPYFGDTRPGVTLRDKVEELTLEEFLKFANHHLAKPEDISHHHAEAEEVEKAINEGSDAPPCIDAMEANGLQEGSRNDSMFHVATYMKRKYPDDWEDKVLDWNAEFCDPPLGSELRVIINQHSKTQYQYRCHLFESICSKKLCMTRKYGIGGGATDGVLPFRVGHIRKINSEEPVYYVSIDGDEIRMTIDDLTDYTRVKKLIIKRLDKNPPNVKQQTWDSALTTLMDDIIIEEAPSIVGETGLTLDLLQRFIDDFSQDENREDAAAGQPYVDGERAYFQSTGFLSFMSSHVKGVRHERVWSVLKEEAGAHEETFEKGDSKYTLWVIPWKGKAKDGGSAF